MEKQWISIHEYLPLEGQVVDTKIEDGYGERNQQHLVRKGNLWFTPDMKMYVYYTPTHWSATL